MANNLDVVTHKEEFVAIFDGRAERFKEWAWKQYSDKILNLNKTLTVQQIRESMPVLSMIYNQGPGWDVD